MKKKVYICQICGAKYTEKRFFESRCPRCRRVEMVGEAENPDPITSGEIWFLVIFMIVALIVFIFTNITGAGL